MSENRQFLLACRPNGVPVREDFRWSLRNIPLRIELRSKALREAYPDADERARAVITPTRHRQEHNA